MDKKIDRGFGRKLREEIELWESEGIVSAIQKERILALYKTRPRPEGKAITGKLVTTLSILGAILAGVGVILFVAANWAKVPVEGKLAVIFTPMVVSYGVGYILRYERGDFPRVGAAFILLGAIIFGAGIFLIAQIYHLSVHFPNGPLIWGLGVLPLAYLLRFKTLLSLSLLVLMLWLGLEASHWVPEYPLASVDSLSRGHSLIILYLLAGVALWAAGLMHRGSREFRGLSGPFIFLGMTVAFLAGFMFTFDIFGGRLGTSALWPFYAGISGLFLVSCLGVGFSREKEPGWVWELVFLFLIMGLGLYLALLFPGTAGKGSKDLMLTANIIFALAIIISLFLGYLRESPGYINIALLFFVVDLVVRYFDYFWELLPRSLFFVIGGLALLLGGLVLERKRRKILGSFRVSEDEG